MKRMAIILLLVSSAHAQTYQWSMPGLERTFAPPPQPGVASAPIIPPAAIVPAASSSLTVRPSAILPVEKPLYAPITLPRAMPTPPRPVPLSPPARP